LTRLLVDAARHPRVKVVVLTGAGSSFCTGADIRSMGAPDPDDAIAQEFGGTEAWQSHEARVDRLRRVAEASFLLHDMGKPASRNCADRPPAWASRSRWRATSGSRLTTHSSCRASRRSARRGITAAAIS
jgi:hypothetical protein